MAINAHGAVAQPASAPTSSSAGNQATSTNAPVSTAPEAQATQVAEVIVTAQKRGEAINTVPMSITAASGDQLVRLGVSSTADLSKLVPGFTFTTSSNGTPVYTLRGVGFNDTSMGGRPTVSIYNDEAPVPFSIETLGSNLDLERVEVLKGPQGTLFGQNATGGAINYIAAKPTNTFTAGVNAGYGNFNESDVGGFISGPITDTLSARLAIDNTYRGDYQKSYTTGAELGSGDLFNGRLLLLWQPTSKLKVQVNINGFHDTRDTEAPQLVGITPNPATQQALKAFLPQVLGYPTAPPNDRAADWDPNINFHRDNSFYQGNLRLDYTLPNDWVLTSITSYSRYGEYEPFTNTGDDLPTSDISSGSINTIFQELRVSGSFLDRGQFIVGVNYEADHVYQSDYASQTGGSISYTFLPLGLPLFQDFIEFTDQRSSSEGVFANLDYKLTDRLRLYGGVRFTEADNKFSGCSRDAGDGNALSDFQPFLDFERQVHGLAPNAPVGPGACLTATEQFVPVVATGKLDQNNVSWRVGADWTPIDRLLVYANVSKGYKAGGFPDLGSTAVTQYTPATQESVLAYETGFKAGLFGRTVQVNGAVFYYDYTNKQVFGYFFDPGFDSAINRVLNIPKSDIKGAELQVQWVPLKGLTLSSALSYIDSRIDNFTTLIGIGDETQNVGGEAFPNTPKYQVTAAADYVVPVADRIDGFVGGDVSYSSRTNSQLGDVQDTYVRAYALVDLRAGIQSSDGAWRLTLYGRNVGDTYYWSGAYRQTDTVVRYAGMPATYGVTLNYRFH